MTTPTQPPTVYRYEEALELNGDARLVCLPSADRERFTFAWGEGREMRFVESLSRADAERLRDWLGRVLGEEE